MTIQLQDQTEAAQIQVAIAWCLVYSPDSGANTANLKALRQYFYRQQPCGDALTEIVTAVEALDRLDYPGAIADLQAIAENNPELLRHKVGLVYGGATKIKPYVFDLPKLHEIRGASALLDNINLVDLPVFFGADSSDEARFSACRNGRNAEPAYPESVRQWLKGNYPELSDGSCLFSQTRLAPPPVKPASSSVDDSAHPIAHVVKGGGLAVARLTNSS
jgi:CRISPR-associated protein Cmr2